LAASLALAVTTVRAPRLDREACVAVSPTAALLLLLVASLLDTFHVLHMWREKAGSITSTIAAAGWSWCLS
jgi:hypothetical protein